MAELCDCEGNTVYEKGKARVEAWADTEDAAMAAMEALLPQAKKAAEAAQTDAYTAALVVGDAACEPKVPPCMAVFQGIVDKQPWKAVGAVAPYNRWLARGGYNWKVILECEIPPVAVAVKDEAGSQEQLKK